MVTNGNIPLTVMVQRGGVYLWPSTAARFDLMNADLVRLGHPLMRISTPLGGYRSIADQVEAKRLYGRTAATPGYSNHGLGRAFDVNNISRYPDAVIGLAGLKHGLIRNAGNGAGGIESWHFYDTSGIMPAGTSTSGGSTIPIVKGFLMALTDTQQEQMYAALVQTVPGGAYYKTDAMISIMRAELGVAIAGIAAGGIAFPGAPYNGLVAIVNAIRSAGGQPEVDVDETKLAAELAPALAPLLAANVGTLTDATVDELIKKLLDEQARRLTA